MAAARIGVKFGGCGINLPIASNTDIYMKDRIFSFVIKFKLFIKSPSSYNTYLPYY